MAEAIDTAFVDIRPDFSGFAVETERGIKRNLAGVSGSLAVDSRGLRRASGDIRSTSTGLAGLKKNATGATGSLALLGGTAARAGVVGSAGIAGLGVAAAIGIQKVTQASIDFETAFSGVRKTVAATEPQLKAIRQDIIDLSTEIPVAATELAGIAESAGQLGVKTSAIGSFTKTVAELGVTTNLTSEQAADAFARIANITRLPQDQFDNMGSTVVDLGNKLAATEAEITDFGLRIAGAGKQVGLSNADILSIGAALSSVGLEAEAGGTAISTTLIKIASSVAKGGKTLKAFADVAGTSSKEFADQFKKDPAAALVAFVNGLGRVKKEGGNVFATLETLGLGGIRVRDALLRSAGAGDLLARALRIGDEAWKSNTALQREASIRFETTASKIQVLRNQVNALAIDLGDKLGPAIGDGAEALGEGIESLRENEDVGDTISRGLDNIRKVVEPLFETFRRNKGTIVDTFKRIGEQIRIAAVIAKPFAVLIGVTLVAAFEVAFFAIDKVNGIMSFFADVTKKSISIAVGVIDIFLHGVELLVRAVDAIPLVDMSGTVSAIRDARAELGTFVDDLNGVDGKTVTTKVELQLPTQELFTFEGRLAALQGKVPGPDESGRPTGPIPFGQPGFKVDPTPKPAAGKKVGDVDLGPPLAKIPGVIAAKEQRLQDNLAIAQALDDSLANDRVALAKLVDFYREQAHNQDLSIAIRRGFMVKSQQTQQTIRDLGAQEAADIQSDAETRARNVVAAADATENNLKDDIAARRKLVAVLKNQVVLAKQSGQGVASAQAAVADAERDLAEKISERKTRRIDIRIEGAKTAVEAADATEGILKDDIATRRRLVSLLKIRVGIIRATHGDVAAATRDLRTAQRDLGKEIRDTATERADLALDAIRDNQQLASFTKGIADDKKWLRAEERFWKNRVASLKKGTVERRKAKVQLERTRKDIRDLNADATEATGGTTIVELLTRNAQSIASFGSNIGQAGIDPLSGFDANASLVAMLRRQQAGAGPSPTRPETDMTGFQGGIDRLVEALDRNTKATQGGNQAATGDSSPPPKPGQGAWRGGTWMSFRHWDAARARRIAEESTSG